VIGKPKKCPEIMRMNTYKHQIEAAAYVVSWQLGQGLGKADYHKAFVNELINNGLSITISKSFNIFSSNVIVGNYVADICIGENIVVQVMAVEILKEIEEAKLTNYLTRLQFEFGYLINFGQTTEVRHKFRKDRV
jgi:GxxExxY protein